MKFSSCAYLSPCKTGHRLERINSFFIITYFLSVLFFWRGVMDLSSFAVIKRHLIEPIKLDANIKRSLLPSCHDIPIIECSATLDFVKVRLPSLSIFCYWYIEVGTRWVGGSILFLESEGWFMLLYCPIHSGMDHDPVVGDPIKANWLFIHTQILLVCLYFFTAKLQFERGQV